MLELDRWPLGLFEHNDDGQKFFTVGDCWPLTSGVGNTPEGAVDHYQENLAHAIEHGDFLANNPQYMDWAKRMLVKTIEDRKAGHLPKLMDTIQ
jgi:CobQ-like glutamine amidotransferase family enzyme